jgi:tetratricopeptide (TPR) repeat protein
MNHSIYYLKIIVLSVFCLQAAVKCNAQLSQSAVQEKFKKAEQLYNQEKYSQAEKLYDKIIGQSEHGKSLMRKAEILERTVSKSPLAFSYYWRAISSLRKEADLLDPEINIGQLENINESIEKCIINLNNCRTKAGFDDIDICGNSDKSLKNGNPIIRPEGSENAPGEDITSIPEMDDTPAFLREGEIMVLKDKNLRIMFYQKGKATSFLQFQENPVPKWRLPSYEELRTILEFALKNKRTVDVFRDFNWDDRQQINFITNESFTSDQNEQKNTGCIVSRANYTFADAEVEFGESTSIILVYVE